MRIDACEVHLVALMGYGERRIDGPHPSDPTTLDSGNHVEASSPASVNVSSPELLPQSWQVEQCHAEGAPTR